MTKNMEENQKINLSKVDILLAYADYMWLWKTQVMMLYKPLKKSGEIIGLEINQQKSKYICILQSDTDETNLKVSILIFMKDCQFKYVGVNINSTNIINEETKTR